MWVKYRNKNWLEFESQIWKLNLRVKFEKMCQNTLFPTTYTVFKF